MIKGFKKIVGNLLRERPDLRDDDLKLVANIWWLRVSDTMVFKLSEAEKEGVKKFLGELASGNLPDSESIRRTRRKLQELEPELRGKLWEKRHKAQKEVSREIALWE